MQVPPMPKFPGNLTPLAYCGISPPPLVDYFCSWTSLCVSSQIIATLMFDLFRSLTPPPFVSVFWQPDSPILFL